MLLVPSCSERSPQWRLIISHKILKFRCAFYIVVVCFSLNSCWITGDLLLLNEISRTSKVAFVLFFDFFVRNIQYFILVL